jgi:hypothetical protein
VYTVGSLNDILYGLCDLNGKTVDDQMREANPKGADLIVYTAMPGTFDEDGAGVWEGVLTDDDKYPVPDRKKVMETMELAASLVARNGLVMVITPMGCPPGWFTMPAVAAKRAWGKDSKQEKSDGEKGKEEKGKGVEEEDGNEEMEKKGRRFRLLGACGLHVIRYEQVRIEKVELETMSRLFGLVSVLLVFDGAT